MPRISSNDNSLATLNPDLVKEWHPTKNGMLTVQDVTTGSHKKVWWKCNKGHEWKTAIHNRAKTVGTGCPYCSGKKACHENCLKILNSDLARQWHPTKNRDLTTQDVTCGSQKKVWWMCTKGHEWQSTVVNRTKGRGCPYCSGRRKLEK